MRKILVVDDDDVVRDCTQQLLRAAGYQVRALPNAEELLSVVDSWQPSAIILDIILPGTISGLDALRALRSVSDTPVILVSALDNEADKVLGLEYADDYVVKPCRNAELLARVRAVLRRTQRPARNGARSVIEIGDLRIDRKQCAAVYQGRPLGLTATEYRILVALASDPGRVFAREELVEKVWGTDVYLVSHTLDTHIRNIRKKLEPDPKSPCHLVAVRGLGFRYVP